MADRNARSTPHIPATSARPGQEPDSPAMALLLPWVTERALSSMRETTAPVRAVAAWYARHSCTVASIVSRRAARAFVDLLPAAMTPATADKEPSGA